MNERLRKALRGSVGIPLPMRIVSVWMIATPVLGATEVDLRAGTLDDVVVTSPLPGAVIEEAAVPANVQRLRAKDLSDRSPFNLAQALGDRASGVSLSDTQANPFQPDVNYRGFAGSAVLGTPQGLSVYVDGVRVNEAFGDTVNWQLIPEDAIESIEVIPGSNPLFGLNTLGAAIVVTTKRGRENAGTQVDFETGSFGREAFKVASGMRRGDLDGYVSANVYRDTGWARHNPSELRQGLAKLGYRDDANDVSLSITRVTSALEGNQTLPVSWMQDPSQAYTWPDRQGDSLAFLALNALHQGLRWTLSGNGYYRALDSNGLNSNVNNEFNPDLAVGDGNQPMENILQAARQERAGATLQASRQWEKAGIRHSVVLGGAYDHGLTSYSQYHQEAGSSRDTTSTEPVSLTTRLRASNQNAAVYFSDLVRLTGKSYLSVSARYNAAGIRLVDGLGAALNGRHHYSRWNPAVGLTVDPVTHVKLYVRYEEAMRTPTPVELTCADPFAPCSLPNAFAADPPLLPVIARTVEVGGQGSVGTMAIAASLFGTELRDDIQFVASGAGSISTGYFRNVGHTRRRGLEIDLQQTSPQWDWSVNYTQLLATFRSHMLLNSPNNSTAVGYSCAACTEIEVGPGDRIPAIPRHSLKARAAWKKGRGEIALSLAGYSSRYARGDENNRDAAGALPGYVLLNADFRYALAGRWSVYARIDNLLDRRYAGFAVLGQNVFTADGQRFDPSGASWRSEQFRAVGAPRGAWIGVRWRGSP